MVLNLMVFRRRNQMALRPINRIKHVVDLQATVAKNTDVPQLIALATDTPTLAATSSVETGCKINGFYLRIEIASNDPVDLGVVPNAYIYLWKNPGGNLTTLTPNAVGANDNKRFVIHQEMTMFENKGQGSNARTIFNGVIAIPRGMRRMGPNDKWEIVVRAGLDIVFCLQCHYKEFR